MGVRVMSYLMEDVEGITDKYSIKYKWVTVDDGYKLSFLYEGKEYLIKAPKVNEDVKIHKEYYDQAAKWRIDEFIGEILFLQKVAEYEKGQK